MSLIRVKLSTSSPGWPLARQSPGCQGIWGNCHFLIDDDTDECDVWVVYAGLAWRQTASCPPQNTVFVDGEPPSVKGYPARFLHQFATLVTCRRGLRHPRVIHQQQGLPWHVGRRQRGHVNIGFHLDYDELCGIEPVKEAVLSVVCSNKALTRGHRARLRFVERLQRRLGDRLATFGRGFREVEDKWDAIAPFRYHLAIENCRHADYWTEKLSDAFLGLAYPFYHGCPNLAEYFPADTYTPIDIADFDRAADTIEAAIAENLWERSQPALKVARELVLNRYNVFPMLAELVGRLDLNAPRQTLTLRPEHEFLAEIRDLPRQLVSRLQRGLLRLMVR